MRTVALSFSALAHLALSLFLRMQCSLEENELQLIVHLNAAEHSAHSSNTLGVFLRHTGSMCADVTISGLSVCVGPKGRES